MNVEVLSFDERHCAWHTAKAGTGDWRLAPNVMNVLVERFGP